MRRYRILIPFLVFIFYSAAFSQVNNPVTYKILGISVEGNKTADVNTIIVNSGLKIGDEIQVPGDQTLNAIKNLWNLNIFSDIQILEDKKVGDGIFLTIKVTEYPRIEKTVIVGNDELSTSDIEEKIHFGRGQILTPEEVNNLKLKILKMYEDDGYLNAVVEPEYFIYFTADTSENFITVTWRNEKDLADEDKV
ncbi:MAG: POTRA domain-containing protein, partial [Ignavibacteriaceae bacterium]